MPTPTISIIIPALNEERIIGPTLAALTRDVDLEILLVDGGSTDRTPHIAQRHGVRLLKGSKGRGLQLNAGAAAARGTIFLFLHADTRLPPDFADQIPKALKQPGVAAGAFSLRIKGPGLGFRLLELLINLRSRFLQMPYGDQAIFMSAEMFRAVDGFPNLKIMEDFEMIRKLRKRGRIKILRSRVLTSARRWQTLGLLRTTLLNQAVILGYLLKIIPPERLASWYNGKKRP